ncbi:MAG: T9SS type A sorting domain-containing protein, partial [Gemmatimonadota bacterium]
DIGCVEPLKSTAPVQAVIGCTGAPVALTNTAAPGPIVLDHAIAGNAVDQTAPAAARAGYILYVKGHFFQVMLDDGSPPAKGTQWTMRDYIGAISGGSGAAGNSGQPYAFTTQDMPRPLTAIGAAVKVKYQAVNEVQGATAEQLSLVHTVPDPYYLNRDIVDVPIRFVHLPEKATVRIYSVAGRLVRVLKHDSALFDGELNWDLRTRENKYVASGVYFYHVTAENGVTTVGRLTIVHQLK